EPGAIRSPQRRALRRVPRAAVDRPAHREPVRAVLADVESQRLARRVAAARAAPLPAHHRSRRIEVGSARQARPAERERASAVPGAGRPEPVVDAILLAQAGRGVDPQPRAGRYRTPAVAWAMNASMSPAGRAPVVRVTSRPPKN